MQGFPSGVSGKEPACQCRRCKRHGFDPRVRKIPWIRKWQPIPVFLPGETHGQRSLVGCSPWGHKELIQPKWVSMHTCFLMGIPDNSSVKESAWNVGDLDSIPGLGRSPGEGSLESPLDFKEIRPVNPQGNQSRIFIRRMLKLKLQYFGHLMWRTYSLEKPWCWERLKAGAEEDNRGWDGWMSSLIQWTWVWASFRSWWWTRKPGVSQSMGLQSQIRLSKWTENTVMVTYNATPSWSARFLLRNMLISLWVFPCK